VENLALSFNISVITWIFLLITIEGSFRDFRVNWIVSSWFSGDGRIVSLLA
jgi:hypothetical protein